MILEPWRRRVGTALFLRVAGPDGIASRERIHGTPGPRWFAPDAAIRRVHGDASMFVGGLRALLLQSLHPAAMAGVAGHSGYRGDPWGRLARTSTFLAVTAFGTADDAQAAVDRVRAVHARVRGRTPDGVPYRADDPELQADQAAARAWMVRYNASLGQSDDERRTLLRERLRAALQALPGVRRVYPSQANFLLVRFADAEASFQALLGAGIVVRDQRAAPALGDALRITIGTPAQNARVLEALAALDAQGGRERRARTGTGAR